MRYVFNLLHPIRNNVIFFIFFYTLGLMTSLMEFWKLNFDIQYFDFISHFFDAYIICIFFMVLPKSVHVKAMFLVSLWVYVIAIIELFCVDKFSAKISPEILNVVLDTNQREASEFVDQFINANVLFSPVGVIIFLMFIHIIAYTKEERFIRELKAICLPGKRLFFIRVLSVFLLFAILGSFYFCSNSRIRLLKLMCISELEKIDTNIDNFTVNTPTANLLFSLKVRQLANKELDKLANAQYKIKIDSCDYLSKHIVLIIGESYIKCHSQLYGYKLPTTPRQLARASENGKGHLVPFSDVITPSNLTSIVFKNVFSLRSAEDSSSWSSYPLFPVFFRMAGFKTLFITNQFVPSLNADIFNISGGLFLNDKRLSKVMFTKRNSKTHQYDMELIEDYYSLRQYNSEPQLTIFHLAGQHIYFNKRYPSEWERFTVADYSNRKELNNSERQSVADYDNATLYNDAVVDSIISIFEKDDAIILYMPDHGEECYDELKRVGRISGGTYTPEVLRQEYRVPFWIWCSDSYIANHPDIFREIKAAKDKPFMTDDLPHLLIYLAGIHSTFYNDKKNPIMSSFNVKRKRLINGIIDYDEIMNSDIQNKDRSKGK